ncbi:hypothetical protein N8388_04600 [Octadecabacter sp.]|nr:hypothetical protein [Octadecabacter sp.]
MADDIFDTHFAANQVEEEEEERSAFQTSAEMRSLLQASRQRNFLQELAAGFQSTAIAGGIRRAGDEGTAALEAYQAENPDDVVENEFNRPGMTPGQMGATLQGIGKGLIGGSFGTDAQRESYVKADNVEDLINGIPSQYHDDIMSEDTLEAAQRARARILADMERQAETTDQYDGGITQIAGQLLDVDAPLMFLSGGMYGAAKVARTVSAVTRSQRAVGAAQGVVGGAQAGLLVGAYDAHIRETAGEGELVASILGGAALGGLLAGAVGKDLRGPLEAAENDYLRRVAEDDLTLAATNETVAGPTPERPLGTDGLEADAARGPSTVGAAQIGGQVRVERDLVDPLGLITPGERDVIDNADVINYESGFYDRKFEDEGNFWTRVSSNTWASAVGAGFQSRLYNSNSAVLNWMGHSVFESSSGLNRGRATASALMENYSKRIQTQLLPVQSAANDWAQRNGMGAFGTRHGISNEGKSQFNREVMLERNARNHGRRYSDDEAVIRAADAYDNAARDSLNIGKGRDGEHSIKGMEDIAENPHYTPQNWSGRKITDLISRGIVTRDNLVMSLAESYREAGMAMGKDADAVAEAVIRRVELRDADIDTSVFSLLQGDGRAFLRDSLEMAGVRGPEQEAIMTRLAGAAENRGKPGFAKSRNDVDMQSPIMTEDGSQLMIIDMLSNDLSGDWQRYTRGVAGSAALARQGITSKAARAEAISAAQAEQRALGEEVTATAELEAMFTNFDAGATKGWSGMDPAKGPESQGMLPVMMKRLTNLAWLGKMGFTQVGETGAIMAQNGVGNWMRRGVMANLDRELKAGNKELLDDLAYMTGEIGQDHKLFAEHLSLDELSDLDSGTMMSKVDKNLSTASYVQGFTSFFNSIRGWQQQTAALGVSDKIFRILNDSIKSGEQLSDGVKARMWGDLGLDGEALTRLEQLITDGTIEFSPDGFVNRLNADRWDGDLADMFGASITRNTNQVVQKSMAGEQDAWMHTGWGSVLSHLKTFPLQATQKQFVRHFRHNDPQAYAALGMGLATAGVASMVRAGIDGKSGEMSVEDHAKRAFAYSNMTGFIPMAYDPLMTMMGLDDKRFNQFGRHAEVMPPVLSFTNNAIRLPGALAAAANGTADGSDKQAMRVIPFSSTILVGNMLNGIAERNK